jgi:hypothetical protein
MVSPILTREAPAPLRSRAIRRLVQQKDVSLENCFDVLSGWSDYYENLLLVSSENLNDTLTQSDSVLLQAR